MAPVRRRISAFVLAVSLYFIVLILSVFVSAEEPVRATILYSGTDAPAADELVALASESPGDADVRRLSSINAVSVELPVSALDEIKGNPGVLAVELSMPVQTFLVESVPLIGADAAWGRVAGGKNTTGAGTSICIIDTGVDYNHTDLGDGWGKKVIAGYNAITNTDCSLNNTACFDDNGHGTHVSGIAAANGSIKGVAPDAKIVAVKALNAGGNGNSSDVVAGIDWCVNHSQQYNISAISMSLGDSRVMYASFCDGAYDVTATAINSAMRENISVVAATGNAGNHSGVFYPACIQNATRVGATTEADSIWENTNRGAGFSDMLLAPGSNINSTWPSGYHVESGTSMAVPHVSGALALLYQTYLSIYGSPPLPGLLRAVLNETGIKIHDRGTGLNFSRININAAIGSGQFTPPAILSAYNSITGNESRIVMNETDSAFFNLSVAAGQQASFGWYLNNSLQNSTAANFTWQTAYNDSGNWTLSVTVSNGYLNNSFYWNITVLNVNRPPYIAPQLDNLVMQRQNQTPYNISANVHDDDGDTLTITADDGNITVSGAVLFFNYSELVAGKPVMVSVKDSADSAGQLINITVMDTRGPQISIASPGNLTYNSTKIHLNFSFDEPVDWCGYSLDSAPNVTLQNCSNAAFDASNGQRNITLYSNDTLGNWNGKTVYFSVDAPVIHINVSFLNYTADDFVFVSASAGTTASELLDSCTLSFAGNNYLMERNGTLCSYNLTSVSPGTYDFSVFANGSAGTENRTDNFSVRVHYCFETYGGWSSCSSGVRQRSHILYDCTEVQESEPCANPSPASGGGSSGSTGGRYLPPLPKQNKTAALPKISLNAENKTANIESRELPPQVIVLDKDLRNGTVDTTADNLVTGQVIETDSERIPNFWNHILSSGRTAIAVSGFLNILAWIFGALWI